MTNINTKERVLSTLREDGSRRWIKPRLSKGWYLRYRRMTAYTLILVFVGIPFINFRDKPLVLLDFVHREFTLFGYTFLPTDTVLLAIFILCVFVAIFLLTALFGRVWCGWALSANGPIWSLYFVPLSGFLSGIIKKEKFNEKP